MTTPGTYYTETTPPLKVWAEAERILAWCALDLGLRPAPTIRYVTTSEPSARAVFALTPAPGQAVAGAVFAEQPDVIVLNTAAPDLARAVAHEARHVWQTREFPRVMWRASNTRLVEADADRYADDALARLERLGMLPS